MKKETILKSAGIYNKYVCNLFTLYRMKKLKEEIDQNKSTSSK